MDQHLSLSEARAVTGKSESTLKRLLREIVANPAHPDRSFILPSGEEIERRKAANEPYVWKIDRQLLLRRFPADEPIAPTNRGPTEGRTEAAPPDIMLQVLREQLESKDRQIQTLEGQLDRKDEQISNLNERMRESNVLMRELQQKLALPSPKPETPDQHVEAKSATSPKSKATTTSSANAVSTTKTTPKGSPKATTKASPKKRSFFGRFFHDSK